MGRRRLCPRRTVTPVTSTRLNLILPSDNAACSIISRRNVGTAAETSVELDHRAFQPTLPCITSANRAGMSSISINRSQVGLVSFPFPDALCQPQGHLLENNAGPQNTRRPCGRGAVWCRPSLGRLRGRLGPERMAYLCARLQPGEIVHRRTSLPSKTLTRSA